MCVFECVYARVRARARSQPYAMFPGNHILVSETGYPTETWGLLIRLGCWPDHPRSPSATVSQPWDYKCMPLSGSDGPHL